MAASGIFSLILLGTAGILLDSHRRAWRSLRQDESTSDPERRFGRSQYIRRMIASGIIGLTGVVIGVGPLIPHQPVPMAIYVLVLLSACCWLLILAAIDALAIRRQYRRKRVEYLAEQLELVRELKDVRQSRRAGASDSSCR